MAQPIYSFMVFYKSANIKSSSHLQMQESSLTHQNGLLQIIK